MLATINQKSIKTMIKTGEATEITSFDRELYDNLKKVATSAGIYGINGAVFEHRETGRLYAIPERSSLLFSYA